METWTVQKQNQCIVTFVDIQTYFALPAIDRLTKRVIEYGAVRYGSANYHLVFGWTSLSSNAGNQQYTCACVFPSPDRNGDMCSRITC